ncbi:MAG: hypothetical protein ACD_62C00267G0001 [uncultured bacterium]|nr:MAG: hypothetical protein ACD_62C00267G0001 [uncultured bacterium]
MMKKKVVKVLGFGVERSVIYEDFDGAIQTSSLREGIETVHY